MSLDRITKLLPKLTSDELVQLSNRVKSLLSLSSATNGSNSAGRCDGDTEFVLDCCKYVMLRTGADDNAEHMLRRSVTPDFRNVKVPSLMRFLRRQHPDLVGQRQILIRGLTLLHDDMVEGGYVCSAKTLLAHMHRIPAVLNKHYPHYAQAGMLGWLVRERKEQ